VLFIVLVTFSVLVVEMLTVPWVGDRVAKESNIDQGIGKYALCACYDFFVCYSCAVSNEAALIKAQKKEASAPVL
jgi:hypothetical protein